MLLNNVGNGGKSSDCCQARENMQAAKSAGKQKRRQEGTTKRGAQARETQVSQVTICLVLLPDWLKINDCFDWSALVRVCHKSVVTMSKP